MANSNFRFLETEHPLLYNIGLVTKSYLRKDPVVSLIKMRQFGEQIAATLFNQHAVQFPEASNFTCYSITEPLSS